jgi:hypothetical protein
MIPNRFGILLSPGADELDFVGPMLCMCSQHAGGPRECLRVAQRDAPVDCAQGLRVLPHCDFAAGLLQGRRAPTHRGLLPRLRMLPGMQVGE